MSQGIIIGMFAIFCGAVALPGIITYAILKNKSGKRELELMKAKQELLKLEIQKDETKIKSLEIENRTIDKKFDLK